MSDKQAVNGRKSMHLCDEHDEEIDAEMDLYPAMRQAHSVMGADT